MWPGNNNNEGDCKGIRVKYVCGGLAAGFLYPICIIIFGLSVDELQHDDVIVVPVEGFSVNIHMDPRNIEVEYLCFVGTNSLKIYL